MLFLGARAYEKQVTVRKYGRESTSVQLERYELGEFTITKWLSNYCDKHGNIRGQPEKSDEFVSSVLHVKSRGIPTSSHK